MHKKQTFFYQQTTNWSPLLAIVTAHTHAFIIYYKIDFSVLKYCKT